MIDPKLSEDGNCPACSSSDWKLAKMVARSGETIIDTESSGGGWGVTGGIGRGQGGVSVNYQGMEVDTVGTHTTGIALDNQPPSMPANYHKKDEWLQMCRDSLDHAAKIRQEVDEFAHDRTAVTPGFLKQTSCDGALTPGFLFKGYVKSLHELHAYEYQLALWEKTRVCSRCGEGFITKSDQAAAKPSFDVPVFHFSRQEDRCPACDSYRWKTAEAYFAARLHIEGKSLETLKKQLEQAHAHEQEENPRLWARILHKISIIPSVEAAEKALTKQEEMVDGLKKAWQTAANELPNYQAARVCANCEKMYCLPDNA